MAKATDPKRFHTFATSDEFNIKCRILFKFNFLNLFILLNCVTVRTNIFISFAYKLNMCGKGFIQKSRKSHTSASNI